MKPSRVKVILERVLRTDWALFVWGPPGVGKSSIVREVAGDLKMDLIDIRASLLDPTDLRGIPTVSDGVASWCPPSFLPQDATTRGIIFFDELNAAPPLVQASLYQLTLDRRVGEYVLPKGWRIIAAGNRAEDGAITFRMPTALSNRFAHIDFEVDFEDWRTWAIVHEVHPMILGFLSLRQELLFQANGHDRSFPTPRTWEMASDVLREMGSPAEAHDLMVGVVGEGPAVEFLAYSEKVLAEEQVQAIVDDPGGAALPEELGSMYVLVAYLTSRSGEKKVRDASAILLHRLPVEMAVLLLRNILKKQPKFVTLSRVQDFTKAHGDLIL